MTPEQWYDAGFTAAIQARASVSVITGEAEELNCEEAGEKLAQMEGLLEEANERLAQLEAGFRPAVEIQRELRRRWVDGFAVGGVVGAIVGLLIRGMIGG